MKKPKIKQNIKGFSLIELLITMVITLILLGATATLFSSAMGTRERESRKTDALTAARAAINVISREISNSGYGMASKDETLYTPINGIVIADTNQNRIHFRSNVVNGNGCTNDRGEDITYFFDANTNSIVRHERFANDLITNNPCSSSAVAETETSVVVNRISSVTFRYFNYVGRNSTPLEADGTATPTANTCRIRITVEVQLEDVQGQPDNQRVTFVSDVTLRNSEYMLNQY